MASSSHVSPLYWAIRTFAETFFAYNRSGPHATPPAVPLALTRFSVPLLLKGRAVVFGLKNYSDAEAEALRLAFADASKKATMAAGLAKVEIGAVRSVELPGGNGRRMYVDGENADLPTPHYSLSADSVEIQQTVEVTYEKK